MVLRLFRSGNRNKKSAKDDAETSDSGYDKYGMANDKQWARKYLLDPLVAPEPYHEAGLYSLRSRPQPPPRDPGSAGGPREGHHQEDLHDALQTVNMRLLEFKKQMCRRHSSVNNQSQRQDQNQGQSRSHGRSISDTSYNHHGANWNKTTNRNTYSSKTRSYHQISGSMHHRHSHYGTRPNSIWDLDPSNPYYGTASSSTSSHHNGQKRQSMSGRSHDTPRSSFSRPSSSADTTASSTPPSLYNARTTVDLGPYPAHLTHPRPQQAKPRQAPPHHRHTYSAPPASWGKQSCSQLEKARILCDRNNVPASQAANRA